MIFAALSWIGLALCYLVFAGKVSRNEFIAGVGASLLATAYAVVAHRAEDTPLHLRLRWDRVLASVARSLVADTARVGAALLRPLPGAIVAQSLPSAPGPRAVAILAASLAPNAYVVGTQAEHAESHQLVRTPSSEPPT